MSAHIKKASTLVKKITDAVSDLKIWRKQHGAKKTWSAHTKLADIEHQSHIKAHFDALESYLKTRLPDHWLLKNQGFAYNKTLTTWTWGVLKDTPKTLCFQDLAHFTGGLLALIDMCEEQMLDPGEKARLSDLGLDSDTSKTFLFCLKRQGQSKNTTKRMTLVGTTPTEALLHHFSLSLIKTQADEKTVLNAYKKKKEKVARLFATTQVAWSASAVLLPKLFSHPTLCALFGTPQYDADRDILHRYADFDAAVKECLDLADEITISGDRKPFLVFTSPTNGTHVLAHCRESAILIHMLSHLCAHQRRPLLSRDNVIYVGAVATE